MYSGEYYNITVILCEIDTSKMYNIMHKKCIAEDIITILLCEIHTSTLFHCVRQTNMYSMHNTRHNISDYYLCE